MGKILKRIEVCLVVLVLGLILGVVTRVCAEEKKCACDFKVEDIKLNNSCNVAVSLKKTRECECLPPYSAISHWASLQVTVVDEHGKKRFWDLPWLFIMPCLYSSQSDKPCWILDSRHFLSPGKYKITAYLDCCYNTGPSNWVGRVWEVVTYDPDLNNNRVTKFITCSRPLPDLSVKKIWTESKKEGCIIKVKIKNEGGLMMGSSNWDRIPLKVKKGSQSSTFLIRNCSGYSNLGRGGEAICEVPAPVGRMRNRERGRVTVIIERSENLLREENYRNNKAVADLWCFTTVGVKKEVEKPSKMLNPQILEQHKQPPRVKWPNKAGSRF